MGRRVCPAATGRCQHKARTLTIDASANTLIISFHYAFHVPAIASATAAKPADIADLAARVVDNVSNTKLGQSNLVAFLRQLRDGAVRIEGSKVVRADGTSAENWASEFVAKAKGDWASEFTANGTTTRTATAAAGDWASEFAQGSTSDDSWCALAMLKANMVSGAVVRVFALAPATAKAAAQQPGSWSAEFVAADQADLGAIPTPTGTHSASESALQRDC